MQGTVLSWNNLCNSGSLIVGPLILAAIYSRNKEAIYYVSSEKNQEMVDVYVFDPNIIMYNSVFYETENAIDYSYIREQIENNKRS